MLNYIWFGLMAVALVVAVFNGTAEAVTKATVDSASTAVEISIGLVGVMTLWLGVMRIAEAAGLVTMLGRALRPALRGCSRRFQPIIRLRARLSWQSRPTCWD